MRFFLSTVTSVKKIHAHGKKSFTGVDLLTVSIVNENGDFINILSNDFNPSEIEDKSLSVITESSSYTGDNKKQSLVHKCNLLQDATGLSIYKIQETVANFLGQGGYLYGYLPHIDFFVLERMLGVNLKEFYTRDLKQIDDALSETVSDDYWIGEDDKYPIPSWAEDGEPVLPPSSLQVARWCKDLFFFMEEFKSR